jgi:regulator of RNase E activity RraB
MDELPEWHDRTLAEQRQMTAETWNVLRERGVDEQTALRLEFFYAAPDRESAELLATYLAREADYELATTADETEAAAAGAWLLRGRTRQTAVSLAILDQWVAWMVTAGAENGGCVFDGWGTSVPQAT